jgi:hypothetical protein
MRTTALLVGPTVAVLLGTPHLKPPPAPAPVEIMVKAEPETMRRIVRHKPRKVIKVETIAPGKAIPKKKKDRGNSTGTPPGLPVPRQTSGGPDLPWPCWVVKAHAAGKSEAQLRAEGRAAGIKLTPKQEMQAKACLRS